MSYEKLFLTSLLITLCIEMPIVFFLVRKKVHKVYPIDILFIGMLASLLTIPYLWFILPIYIHNYVLYVVIGEIAVILIESLIYWRLLSISYKHSLLISIIANVVSSVLGAFIIQLAF